MVAKSSKNESDEVIEIAVATAEIIALIFGVFVVVGVVAEYVLSRCGLVAVDDWPGLMVASGVALELLFAFRASRLQGEQLRRSDDKLAYAFALASRAEAESARALRELAQANERAAESNRVVEAERRERLKIEERIARRSLSVEQQHEISDALKGFAGKCVHVFSYALDSEAGLLASEIISALNKAGITPENRIASLGSLGSLMQGIVVDGPDADLQWAVQKALAFKGNFIAVSGSVGNSGQAGMRLGPNAGARPADAKILVGFKMLDSLPGGPR